MNLVQVVVTATTIIACIGSHLLLTMLPKEAAARWSVVKRSVGVALLTYSTWVAVGVLPLSPWGRSVLGTASYKWQVTALGATLWTAWNSMWLIVAPSTKRRKS